jgi:hypothetical protein
MMATVLTLDMQMFLGEFDFPFCAGSCHNAFDVDEIKGLFPDAKGVSVYLQPAMGHVLAISTNATARYEEMFPDLDSFGLLGASASTFISLVKELSRQGHECCV